MTKEQPSPPDWRVALEQAAHELDVAENALLCSSFHNAATRAKQAARTARAVLSQPEPEVAGPSDEELLELAAAEMRNAPNWPDCDYDVRNPFPYEAPGVAWLNFARAVLSRWGRPAPAPAGERHAAPVPDCERNWDSLLSPSGGYEMADDAALRDGAQLINGEWWAPVFGCDSLQAALDRIRERLERQAAPVPVAVSERLPGVEDCVSNPRNGQGEWCWGWVQHDPVPYSGRWRMMRRQWLADEAVAWLPAHALPLPSVEVEQ